jgi:hypothetical protein
MRRLLRLTLLVALSLPAAALAGTIGMTLSRTELAVGQTTQVQIELRGGSVSRPKISAPPGLALVELAVFKDSAVQRGRVTVVHRYTYKLTAVQVGTWSFGPARASIDGQTKISATHQITVTEGTGQPPRRSPLGRVSRGSDAASGPALPGQRGGDYYAVASISDDRPYVGESILYEVEIGSFLRTLGRTNWEQPSFSPLSAEPGVEPEQDERQEILDGGRRYTIKTIQIPLFAVEEGRVDIDPASFTMTVARRNNRLITRGHEVTFDANAVQLRVRPLPTEGRPASFEGPVGRFSIKASLDQTQLETGSTATLTVRVLGAGSLRGQELPITLPDSIRVYDEQPQVRAGITSDGITTEVIFRKALVPLEPGTFDLERIELVYFDPGDGKYKVVRSDPLRLTVTGDPIVDAAVVARSAELIAGKERVEVLGIDIYPIHPGARMRGDSRLRLSSPLVLGLLLLPLIGFGGLAARVGGRHFAGTEGGVRRSRSRAAREARGVAREAAKTDDIEGAEEALRSYLTARLDRPGAALSPADAPDAVRSAGAPNDLAEHLGRILGRCEALRYGGVPGPDLASTIIDWLDDAARSWR